MRTIGVLTSGGDAPGMNAAIRAVVRGALYHGMQVYGIREGFEGLMDGNFVKLEARSVGNLLQTGGTFLHTARSKRFMTEKGQEQAMTMVKQFGLDGLVVIGGDGSLHGALRLSQKGPALSDCPAALTTTWLIPTQPSASIRPSTRPWTPSPKSAIPPNLTGALPSWRSWDATAATLLCMPVWPEAPMWC